MWSYYGRKSKLIKHYPKPVHDIIVEPFAGTAVYSLHEDNWKKEVVLIEKYSVIVSIWRYLQTSSKKDILSLPDMKYGDSVDDHTYLSEEEKWLIGFCINRGSASPKKTAAKFNSWDSNKVSIASNIHKIKHWDIREGSYEDVENFKATWFIDPPYQLQGKYYKHNGDDIDFTRMSEFCRDREGQTIVCENEGADWLDFEPLKEFSGQKKRNMEVVWYQNK